MHSFLAIKRHGSADRGGRHGRLAGRPEAGFVTGAMHTIDGGLRRLIECVPLSPQGPGDRGEAGYPAGSLVRGPKYLLGDIQQRPQPVHVAQVLVDSPPRYPVMEDCRSAR